MALVASLIHLCIPLGAHQAPALSLEAFTRWLLS